MKKNKHFETNAIRTQATRSIHKEHSVPIYATSSFIFDNADHARAVFAEETDGNIYARYSNPNCDEFVEKLCLLENTEDGLATSSGMAAIFLALISYLRAGDHIVSSGSIFGTTHQILTNILPRWGITHTFVDIADNNAWKEAIMPQTRLLFVETPSNPSLDLCDLSYLGKLAVRYNLLFVVDNCFATPYLQNPSEFGAHLICHSATKFIDGQGRTLGGAVLGSSEIIKEVRVMARQTGPSLSPFNAWLLSKSLETLAIRMEKHCSNALTLAKFLEGLKDIKKVNYPFLKSHPQHNLAKKQMKLGGGLVSFEVDGSYKRCMQFIDNLKMILISSNLGDSRTIITHPATTTHSKFSKEEREAVNISDNLVRLSVGLEHIDDIIDDIQQALQKAK